MESRMVPVISLGTQFKNMSVGVGLVVCVWCELGVRECV
uniref:Uncharacterized protein n=1 Tax=Arundo donax TaxID=35708 RepID=A0A0A9EMS1_ARUDO